MFSLNLVNMAMSSAIAIMPLSFSAEKYDDVQHIVQQQNTVMSTELRETVFMAERMLSAFYTIARNDLSVFERLNKADLVALLQQTETLLRQLEIHFDTNQPLLHQLKQTLTDTTQLVSAVEYRNEMDRVLLPRTNGNIATRFDQHSDIDDIRRAILG